MFLRNLLRRHVSEPAQRPVTAASKSAAARRITSPAGSRKYYIARLEREFPGLASEVHEGRLSVFAASVKAGMRKPAKARRPGDDPDDRMTITQAITAFHRLLRTEPEVKDVVAESWLQFRRDEAAKSAGEVAPRRMASRPG